LAPLTIASVHLLSCSRLVVVVISVVVVVVAAAAAAAAGGVVIAVEIGDRKIRPSE
jgi:hypothetical protein